MISLVVFALAGGIALFIVLCLALLKPNWYIAMYLLAYTRFLGFVDYGAVEIEGLVNINLFLNAITLCAVAIKFFLGREIGVKGWACFFCIVGFYVFGLVYPFANSDSSFKYAFIDGKNFLFYVFFGYLVAFSPAINVRKVSNVVVALGAGLSLTLFLAVFMGVQVPGYSLAKEFLGINSGVRIISPLLLMLSLFICINRIQRGQGVLSSYIFAGINLFGLALQEHRAVFLASIAMGVVMVLYKASVRSYVIVATILSLAIFVVLVADEEQRVFGKIVRPVQELISQEGAMEGRAVANEMRWMRIGERPFWGYGFIDEKSALGRKLYSASRNQFDQSFGTVDSGYVDLLIRFGVVGTAAFMALWLWRICLSLRYERKSLKLAGALFLVGCLAINITLSVFTDATGIPAICIATWWTFLPDEAAC